MCDLCDSAVDNCHFVDINSIAYLKEAVGYLELLVQVIHGDFGKLPSSLSDLWLSGRYGVRLTVSDTESLRSGLQRAVNGRSPYETVHSRASCSPSHSSMFSSYTQALAYKIYLADDWSKVLKGIRKMMDWDIWPTLQNSWDLIPFSFIIDWFVDVGTIFEKDDIVNYWQYLNITSCVWSFKDVAKPTSGLVKLDGLDVAMSDFTIKRYTRKVQSSPDYPSFDLNNGSGLSSTHILDAGAIIIQR